MNATLDNGTLAIAVADHGAELQSLRKAGREYLWQGDARYWGRRSPVLFPMVVRVWGDAFRVDGRSYPMGQHGFARDSEFRRISPDGATSLLYELRSSEATLGRFPYDFVLRIGYRLDGSSLVVEWEVENTGSRVLPFQIGAHPAFCLPDFEPDARVRGYFAFDTDAPLRCISPAERGCVSPLHGTVPVDDEGMLLINADTFACDTYAIDDSQLHSVRLLDAARRPYITVDFSAPIVALWAPTASKPDCPFVCIEPWYGCADTVGYDGEWTDRRHMNHLAPGAAFRASYRITID